MSLGGWLVVLIALTMLALLVGLASKERGRDWRWARWPLALGVLLFAVLALTTGSWPDGLGIEACTDVVNPALANDPSASPPTIRTCSPVPSTGAVVLFTGALVLFLVAPDLGEFGVPGLLQVKKQVAAQEQQTERLLTQVHRVQASARIDNRTEINFIMDAFRSGQTLELTPAVVEAALISVQAVLESGNDLVSLATAFAYYKHIGGGLLRQFDLDDDDVTDFRSGNGATGQAWSDRNTIIVTGEAVSNDEYGLSAEQQEQFADLTIVGATPIYDLEGRRIVGVLTGSSSDAYEPADEEQIAADLRQALETRARLLSVVLVAYDFHEEAIR